jgi:hypothetical protein
MHDRARLLLPMLWVALTCASSPVVAQDEAPDALLPAPAIPAQSATAEGFAPTGWSVLQKTSGDLDGDGRVDLALIVQNDKQPEALSGFNQDGKEGRKFWPRLLVVALADANGPGYHLLLANAAFISVHQFRSLDDVMEGEPMAVSKGVLSVSFHQFASMGSWSMGNTDYKFRYRNGAMPLIGMERYTIHRASLAYSQTSINFLTHRASVAAGNDSEDAPMKAKMVWHKFDGDAPNLATIVDGTDYWPDGLARLQ